MPLLMPNEENTYHPTVVNLQRMLSQRIWSISSGSLLILLVKNIMFRLNMLADTFSVPRAFLLIFC
jgi:pyruvate decarboxylase